MILADLSGKRAATETLGNHLWTALIWAVADEKP
jgi:hypothetical protein